MTWSSLLIQIHILNENQCRSRSVEILIYQQIWINHYESKAIHIFFSYFCSKHRLLVLFRTASTWGSKKYPQSMFWAELRKIMYTPVDPVLLYMWSVKGSTVKSQTNRAWGFHACCVQPSRHKFWRNNSHELSSTLFSENYCQKAVFWVCPENAKC